MSWLFGYFGNTEQQNFTSPENPLYQFKDSNLILFAGGNKQTCFFKSHIIDSCLAIVGVGLKSVDDSYDVLGEYEWSAYLVSNQINLDPVNGHFVAIKYSDNEIQFFTDRLGLREIFIVKLSDGFGFTTRIDWLKYFINPKIDLREFGARWLLQNQISQNSIVKNVKRSICANAIIKKKELHIEKNIWQPATDAIVNGETFDRILKKLLSVRNKKISLSLSGGLDSRVLLSFLANKNFDLWDTHTFGDPNHPDSKVASDLLISLNRVNEIINDALPSIDKLIDVVKTYSVQSVVTNPVSSILNLRFYDRLANQNRVIIDGGFGEIWRRAFANRLLIIGKKALLRKDSKTISGFLTYNRADIFSDEVLVEMKKGIDNQLDILFTELPDPSQIGPEKWIDLFSIRTRLTNYYAPEQARLDQYVTSFMPLVQKDILNLLFRLNNSDKKNGKLFKQLVKQNAPQLTKQPLVKGNILHPFNSSSLGARLHSRIKSKIGLAYESKEIIKFQNSLKEYIADVIRSSEVRNYDLYDREKLDRLLKTIDSDGSKYNYETDWFLSFELFRQGITRQ
jgi:hypothetical protein